MFNGKKDNKQDPDYEFFTVFDTKSGAYRAPAMAVNRFDMIRSIEMMFRSDKREQSEIWTNAEDFQLFKIGHFWKKGAEMVGHAPEHVANIHDIKASIVRSLQNQVVTGSPDLGIVST